MIRLVLMLFRARVNFLLKELRAIILMWLVYLFQHYIESFKILFLVILTKFNSNLLYTSPNFVTFITCIFQKKMIE